MRRAGGLALLAAVAAGCSTGSIDDLPTAAGDATATVSARGEAVQGLAVLSPAPVVPGLSGGHVQSVPGAPAPVPAPGNYAVQDPQPTPGPPRQVPPQVPATPLDYFRGLEGDCSRAANLATRGRGGLPPVESDRFRDARVVRTFGPGTVLIEDGRGTRLVVESRGSAGRVLPESGRAGDPFPEPYRSGCPTSPFGAGG